MFKDTHREVKPSKKIQMYTESMSREVCKIYLLKLAFLASTNKPI